MNSQPTSRTSAPVNDQSAHDTAGGPATLARPGLWRADLGRVFAVVGLLVSGLAGTSAVLLVDAQTAGAVTPSPTCTSATCTVTFSESGAPVTWDVPTGPAHSRHPLRRRRRPGRRRRHAQVRPNPGHRVGQQRDAADYQRRRRAASTRPATTAAAKAKPVPAPAAALPNYTRAPLGVGRRWRRWRRINSPKQRW